MDAACRPPHSEHFSSDDLNVGVYRREPRGALGESGESLDALTTHLQSEGCPVPLKFYCIVHIFPRASWSAKVSATGRFGGTTRVGNRTFQ